METNVRDNDTTRLAIDFGEMDFEELGRLPEAMEEHADILPSAQQEIIVQTFVPKGLSQEEKDEFVATVQEHLSKSHRKLTFKVVAVDFDPGPAEAIFDVADYVPEATAPPQDLIASNQQQDFAPSPMSSIQRYRAALLNREYWGLDAWKKSFRQHVADYKQWRRSGFTKEKDFKIGGIIGYGRGALSAAVWFGTNRISFPAFMQVGASAFLDWFFSKYEMDVDIFKSTHRLPGETSRFFGRFIHWYNDSPGVKSWIVGNAIGFAAANYFRFWSWIENPERTSAPWSPDALGTYGWNWLIGSWAAAYGAQAPRIIRKKGYISSRSQYYVYSSYGFVFQLGGFLYGLGLNWPAIILATSESLTKTGMYVVAKYLPVKDPRAIVIHPAIGKKEIEEIYYRVGLDERELRKFGERNFSRRIDNLKHGRCEEDVAAEN